MNAVLIMCHKNMPQIIRLVKKCSSDNSIVIVHIDNNLQITEDERTELKNSGAYIAEKAIHGILDDRSLVDIVFSMLSTAHKVEKESNIHFEYYLLLSGQDYLLKPIEYINLELKNNYPKPYIDCTPYSNKNWIYHKFCQNNMTRKYHRWISKQKSILRKTLRASALLLQKICEKTGHSHYSVLSKKYHISIYGGSAWWILPDVAIDYIETEYYSNSKYVNYLLGTITPEETFFQTIAMRSPISEFIEINPIEAVEQNCKTYAYFSDIDKPFKGHPYIFTKADYKKLTSLDCWFARKFDSNVDNEIFDMLDNLATSMKYNV